MPDAFPLTRAAALDRWRDFLPQTPRYAAARNAVTPSHAGVSRLSPAIRLGLLRPAEIVRDTLAAHDFASVEKWLQEVCWRTYWKGWMEARPQVWRGWRRRVRQLRATLPAHVLARCAAVERGEGGVAVMDHFARGLVRTGYLHNHARMWWASYWIHVERLPWELGADFFFRHLLDADPASNTLSWRWVAGLQTPGKTYLVRRSNLERWCAPELLADATGLERLEDGRVNPCPPDAAPMPEKQDLEQLPSTPPELSGQVGIWLHAEDACLEDGPLRGLRPAGVAAFTSTASQHHMGLSPARSQAISTALRDGLERAGRHYGCATLLEDVPCTAQALARWTAEAGLRHLVMMAPTAGPVADVLPRLRPLLECSGVTLHRVRQPWDAELFPLSRAGFFPFWEKARARLLAGGLP